MPASYGTTVGFDAIAVALLGRANPVGIVFAALLFGAMRAGAGLMQIQAGVPVQMVDVLQARDPLLPGRRDRRPPVLKVRTGADRRRDRAADVSRSYGEQATR